MPDFATLWTVAHQAPLSMELSRQEYWSGLPFLLPGDLPNPGIKARSPALQADALLSKPPFYYPLKHGILIPTQNVCNSLVLPVRKAIYS